VHRIVRPFREGDLAGIRAVMEASLAVDRIPGFTAADIDRAVDRLPADPGGAVVETDGTIVGYAIPRHDDLTVHPEHRRRGHGRALVPAAVDIARAMGHRLLLLYVPTHRAGSVAFARAMGFAYHSSLWQFELPPGVPVPAAEWPDGYVARPFDRGEDLDRYVALMNATFADHPTPVAWPQAVVARVHGLPAFDPADIRIVAPADRPDRPVAFSRVEVWSEAGSAPIGWINQIGVLPTDRGRGLGRALLRWGVGHLRARGAGPVQLAVEALNDRALELYRRHGFEATIEWPHWGLAVPPVDGPGRSGGADRT
jgi:mycothiol synthase